MKLLSALVLGIPLLVAMAVSAQDTSWPDLFVLNVDGSGERRLTNDLKAEGEPVWWINGQQIAYSAQNGLQDIFVINSDGTSETNLTDSPDTSESSPSWSPDGRHIAYAALHQDGSSDIMVMNRDGTASVQLTAQSPGKKIKNYAPAWSPDGKWLAFVSDRDDGLPEIYVMDTAGGSVRMLTNYPEAQTYCLNPAWSPDGERIAFSKHVGRESNIFIVDADGSNPVQLTDLPGVEESPSWSPDGRWIAFSATINRSHQIFRIRVDGTGVESLTGSSDFQNWAPSWSQDGKQIVFWSTRPPDLRVPAARDTNKYIIWKDGGISVDLLSDSGPQFRYGVRNADGSSTITPLSKEEATALIRQRGLESFWQP